MRRLVPLIAAALIGLPLAASAATPRVVVELFTSQGCSSCPPANENLRALSDRPDVLALSFAVTYWNGLGWPDSFSKPAYTERQYGYAQALGHGSVWTPQMVIDGTADVPGNDRGELDAALAALPRLTAGPAIAIDAGRVAVGTGVSDGADDDVWLVRFDPRTIDVPVKRGENAGRTLPHRNVVKELMRLGAWRGREMSFALPDATEPGLKTAILVQKPGQGAILAAAVIE